MTDDETLIERLRKKDETAFKDLFELNIDHVYSLAYGILQNEDDAEETAQQTFIAAYKTIDRFEPKAKLSTWLYRITYNNALNILNKRRQTDPLPDNENESIMPSSLVDWRFEPEQMLLEEEIHKQLEKAISTLPPALRAAFLLRDVEQIPIHECADIQNISETLCKARTHRARLLLRERLSEYFSERN